MIKIIFLDIDGVLNGYNWKNLTLFRLAKIFNKLSFIKKHYDIFGVHESKVKRLAKIVKKTNAKIVMSSSWRYRYKDTPYNEQTGRLKELSDLFRKYKIEIIGFTPRIEGSKRDKEILAWLSDHEDEVDKFIILDDENTILGDLAKDKRFIQTSSVSLGTIITGQSYEDTGLKRKHVKRAIKLLNEGD